MRSTGISKRDNHKAKKKMNKVIRKYDGVNLHKSFLIVPTWHKSEIIVISASIFDINKNRTINRTNKNEFWSKFSSNIHIR